MSSDDRSADGKPHARQSPRIAAWLFAAIVLSAAVGAWLFDRAGSPSESAVGLPTLPATASQPPEAQGAPAPELPSAGTAADSPAAVVARANDPTTASGAPQVETAGPPPATQPLAPARADPPAALIDNAGTGIVTLNVRPWGEVYVDGEKKGVTPPMKTLSLPVGRHKVEIRNPAGPTVVRQTEVKKNARVSLVVQF